jgi:cytosine permease
LKAEPVRDGRLAAFVTMIQLVFGFFATSGATAADWGAVCRDARDVRLGGLVGVALAALVLATIPLITVAGALGRSPAPPGLSAELAAQERLEKLSASRQSEDVLEPARREVRAIGAEDFTYRGVLQLGIGGYGGGAMLLILGMPLLGPSCFAPFLFGHRFAAAWPRWPRWAWSLIGGVAAWPLIATGMVRQLGPVFSLVGAMAAPVVGALAADSVRCRGTWPGPRRGVNRAGVLSWAVGFAVGLLPLIGAAIGSPPLRRFGPAAVFAFVAAFLAYALLSRVGLEPPAFALPGQVQPEDRSDPVVEDLR